MNTSILESREDESHDIPKKFFNFDTETFEFDYDKRKYSVEPGETVIYPKYLVNYAAQYLAKKIIKRDEYANIPEKDRQMARVNLLQPEKELELQKKAVACNFEVEAPKPEFKEETPDKEANKLYDCKVCGEKFERRMALVNHAKSHKIHK